MKAEESKIRNILTENEKYVVPPYQRPYCWDRDKAEQLISDIYDSFVASNKEYFIGTLICIEVSENTYEIVDGQQRLTTLSLILAKLRDLIEKDGVKKEIQKRILPINPFTDSPEEPRLKIRKKEFDLYMNFILRGDKQYIPSKPTYTENLFLENFKCIEEFLIQKFDYNEISFCKITEYILERVYVVFVKTESFSSSYRLFNVLNTRGLPLTSADLLKNAIFEHAKDNLDIQNKIEDYWEFIENEVGVDTIDKFLMANIISKKTNRNKAVKDLVEDYLKIFHSEYKGDVISFTRAISFSAENYRKLKQVDFDDEIIKRTIYSLSQLTDEWIPPLLALLNTIGETDEFICFLRNFEKSYMHGWFKREGKGKRELVCYASVAAINSGLKIDQIINIVKKHGENDSLNQYLDSDVYVKGSNLMNLTKTVLFRIERELQDHSVTKHYTGIVSIEHILPQKMTDSYWTDRFSDQEHTEWVHKLGNLTLLSGSKNSKAQNGDFQKKLGVYNQRNQKVSFDMTKDLLACDEWGLQQLKARHEQLVKIAKNIWWIS